MKKSPWGTIQTQVTLSEGITLVSTAGHGGIKLDPKRQKAMPECFRRPRGWYEEDCEWALVCLVYPAAFPKAVHPNAHQTVKNIWPEEYAKWAGKPVPVEESSTLQERAFQAAHANDFVAVAAWGDWHKDVPEGFVGVHACLSGDRQNQGGYYLVPETEYNTHGPFGFVVDPVQHPAWINHP